jgi:hypothetical protein
MRKLTAKLVPRNLMGEQEDFKELQEDIFFRVLSSLVMKYGVISRIPTPNASPWSGD